MGASLRGGIRWFAILCGISLSEYSLPWVVWCLLCFGLFCVLWV